MFNGSIPCGIGNPYRTSVIIPSQRTLSCALEPLNNRFDFTQDATPSWILFQANWSGRFLVGDSSMYFCLGVTLMDVKNASSLLCFPRPHASPFTVGLRAENWFPNQTYGLSLDLAGGPTREDATHPRMVRDLTLRLAVVQCWATGHVAPEPGKNWHRDDYDECVNALPEKVAEESIVY